MSTLFLHQGRNLLPGAELTASHVRPSTAIALKETRKTGNGRVRLGGAYTGAEDTTVEVEIVSTDAGASPQVSSPQFAGAGNGTLEGLAVDAGATAGVYTISLVDLGIDTLHAWAMLYGYTIRARNPGADGNTIRLSVSTAGIVRSAAPYSLLADLSAGATGVSGPEYDWGALALLPSGELQAAAPRICFAADPQQIYRQYKQTTDGAITYTFVPAVARSIPAGTAVQLVTGTYTVTITDGVTTETLAGIVTLYDLLAAIVRDSSLLTVDGSYSAERLPASPNARDLLLRTESYQLPVQTSGSEYVRASELNNLTVPAGAPTEKLSVVCIEASTTGAEVWSVIGSVSGALQQATSGVPWSNEGYEFTIPRRLPEVSAPPGQVWISDINYAGRGDGEVSPPVCLDEPRLGAAAPASMTLRLVWKAVPNYGDCACENTAYTGSPSEECLGIELEDANMGLDPTYLAKLEAVTSWHHAFVAGNAVLSAEGEIKVAQHDVTAANRVRDDVLLTVLADIFAAGVPAAAALTEFDALLTLVSSDFAALSGIDTFALPSATDFTSVQLSPGASFNFTTNSTYRHADGFFKCLAGGAVTNSSGGTNTYVTVSSVSSGSGRGAIFHPTGSYLSGTNAVVLAYLGSVDEIGYQKDLSDQVAASGRISAQIDSLATKYKSRADHVRVKAGLLPKKSDAGTDGSECWQRYDDYGFEVEGNQYLWLFPNHYWMSARRVYDPETGWRIEPTREVGFVLKVECPESLKPGDTVTVEIRSDGISLGTYALNDRFEISVIHGAPLYLSGGVDGNDTHTWRVDGPAGLLPPYAVVHNSEAAYSAGGLHFLLRRGAVANAVGDQWQVEVTGGRWRWRKGGGAWSGEQQLTTGTQAIVDGLQATFQAGVSPSWAAGDLWVFAVEQPHAPGHLPHPDDERWAWDDDGRTVTASWATPQAFDALAVALHKLPVGAVVQVDRWDGAAWVPVATLAQRRGAMVSLLPEALEVQQLRWTVSGAPGAEVGWLFVGRSERVSEPQELRLSRAYAVTRSGGLRPRSAFLGRGDGGLVAWRTWADWSDADAVLAMVDGLKESGDWPLVLVPHHLHPGDARLVRIATDLIEVQDVFQYQQDEQRVPSLSIELPLEAVIE